MPYPAPTNVSAVDSYEWYLVALPVDDAYRRAALDAYMSLAGRHNWGMDEPHPDRETIEQHWLTAIDMTLEEMEMSSLTTIIGHIDTLEAKLQSLIDKETCCNTPTNVTPRLPNSGPNETAGDSIEDNVGTVPSSHGDTTPANWTEWSVQKCRSADLMAQAPAAMMTALSQVVDYEGKTGYAEMVGDLMGRIPGILGQVFEVAWDLFVTIAYPFLDWAFSFSTTIAEIEAVEDDIKCAAYNADGAEAAATAMKAACKAGMSLTLAKLVVDYFPWKAWATAIYTGVLVEADGTEITLSDSTLWNTSADCTCLDYDFEYVATFDSDLDMWERYSATASQCEWRSDDGGVASIAHGAVTPLLGIAVQNLVDDHGFTVGTDKIRVTYIKFDYKFVSGTDSTASVTFECQGDSGNETYDYIKASTGLSVDDVEPTITPVDFDPANAATWFASFTCNKNGGSDPRVSIDNVTIRGKIV